MSGLESHLYECQVMHRREHPRRHEFRHRVFMFCLDLDEIESLDKRYLLFSRNRFNLYSYYDRDHMSFRRPDTKGNLQLWLKRQGLMVNADDKVLLLTFPRVLGYVFNPVSFYFCCRKNGEPLCAVAEVGNTFREMKRFLVPLAQEGKKVSFRVRAPKEFYVSPFSDLDVEFEFRLVAPGERLSIRVDDYEGDVCTLRSVVSGRRAPMTNSKLAWFAIKYPLVTVGVMFWIHWHALILWLKKTPFFRKADRPERQLGVFNPHSSLQQKS